MSNTLTFRKHKIINEWRDPNDEDRLWTRTNNDPTLLCLPPEYDWYLENKGKIYRIQKSANKFSWCLFVDDKRSPWGWDQDGDYVRTLVLCRNGDRAEAIRRAKKLLPNESAFWVEDEVHREKRPGDDAFDAWFNAVTKSKPKKNKIKRRCKWAIGMMTMMLRGRIQNVNNTLLANHQHLPYFLEDLKEMICQSEFSIQDQTEEDSTCDWLPVIKESLLEAKELVVVANRFLIKLNNTEAKANDST
jgi:hypothetical protein